AALGNPVQAAVKLEILERRELAVHERLVAEIADLGALGGDFERSLARQREPDADPQQRRLARAVAAGDDREPAPRELEVRAAQDAFVAERLPEPARLDHRSRL